MSGIINSAGSRSGVIGTTELDYEESSGTVELYDATTGTTNDLGGGTYIMTIIGNTAHIKIACTLSTSSPSNAVYVTLPIANSTGKLQGGAAQVLYGGENAENASLHSIVVASGNSRAKLQTYSSGNLYTATLYFNAVFEMVGIT